MTTREARLAAVAGVYENLAEKALSVDHNRGRPDAVRKRYDVNIPIADMPTYRQAMHEALEMFTLGGGDDVDEGAYTIRQLINTQLEIGGELITGHHLETELNQRIFTVSKTADALHWKMQDWETMNPGWKLKRFDDKGEMDEYVEKHFATQRTDGVRAEAPVVALFRTKVQRVRHKSEFQLDAR